MSPGPIDCTFVSNILVEGSNSANWSIGNGSFGAKSREGGHSNPSNVDQSDSIIQSYVMRKRGCGRKDFIVFLRENLWFFTAIGRWLLVK